MSIYHVTESSGGGKAVERTPFVGYIIPGEIKLMLKQLKNIDKPVLRKFLQVISADLEGKVVSYEVLESIQSDVLNEETIAIIYTGLRKLICLALRSPKTSLKPEIFKEELQDLKIPAEFISDISSLVFGARRLSIDSNSFSSRPRLPKLDALRWKVDVTISTSVLQRVLEPSILMETTLSNGKIHQFEVPLAKFHELRYQVASVLKEMEDLEKRSILQIQD